VSAGGINRRKIVASILALDTQGGAGYSKTVEAKKMFEVENKFYREHMDEFRNKYVGKYLRACQIFCVNSFSPHERNPLLAELYGELVKSRAPVSYRHRPFSLGILDG
jgi:hypothetical protein